MLGLTLSSLLLTQVPPGMVHIPEGDFTMGRNLALHDDQKPAHRVHLTSFFIDETLVTVAQFEAFVNATHYVTSAEKWGRGLNALEGMGEWEWKEIPHASWRKPFGDLPVSPNTWGPDFPVVMVSWVDAQAYCSWAQKQLPTEAQWEYAMRAGATTLFPWGDWPHLPDGGVGLNYWQGMHRKNERQDGHVYLSPAKAFPPNAWGLYDAVGNVWQWTGDWYAPDTYVKHGTAAVNPLGPEKGEMRVARGGSWWCSMKTCSGYGLFARGKTKPTAPFGNNGFRCVKAPSTGPRR